jgi:transcriptional regulator with XRE-family HTH domain
MAKSDYNHLKPWLSKLLKDSGLPVYRVANRAGLTRSTLYYWMNDRYRPEGDAFAKVVRILADELGKDYNNLYMEGLSKFTPRQPGRPKGEAATTRSVTTRRA